MSTKKLETPSQPEAPVTLKPNVIRFLAAVMINGGMRESVGTKDHIEMEMLELGVLLRDSHGVSKFVPYSNVREITLE